MTATTNNKIDYTTIVDGKEEENHWIRKSVLFLTLLVVCLGLYSTTNNNNTRFVVTNEPVAATSSLVRSGAGAGAGTGADVRGGTIVAFHWNPHWENTTPVGKVVNGMIQGSDFVNLVMFEDRTHAFGGPFKKVNDGDFCTPHNPRASWDTLVYDSNKWTPVGTDVHGCLLNNNDRPFVVQKFRNNSDGGMEVTVVGAHFGHPDQMDGQYPFLAGKIGQVSGGRGQNVIFMGDINVSGPSTQELVFEPLGLDTVQVASDLWNTCCLDNGFTQNGDRIGANFGWNAHTTQYPNPNEFFTPTGAYHKPTQLTFNY